MIWLFVLLLPQDPVHKRRHAAEESSFGGEQFYEQLGDFQWGHEAVLCLKKQKSTTLFRADYQCAFFLKEVSSPDVFAYTLIVMRDVFVFC